MSTMVSDESSNISSDSPFLTFSLHSHSRESVSWNIHGEDYSRATRTEWMMLLWCVKLSSFLKDCQAKIVINKKSILWKDAHLIGRPEIVLLVSSNKTVFPDKGPQNSNMGWMLCLQYRGQHHCSSELVQPANMLCVCLWLVCLHSISFRAGVFNCHTQAHR